MGVDDAATGQALCGLLGFRENLRSFDLPWLRSHPGVASMSPASRSWRCPSRSTSACLRLRGEICLLARRWCDQNAPAVSDNRLRRPRQQVTPESISTRPVTPGRVPSMVTVSRLSGIATAVPPFLMRGHIDLRFRRLEATREGYGGLLEAQNQNLHCTSTLANPSWRSVVKTSHMIPRTKSLGSSRRESVLSTLRTITTKTFNIWLVCVCVDALFLPSVCVYLLHLFCDR